MFTVKVKRKAKLSVLRRMGCWRLAPRIPIYYTDEGERSDSRPGRFILGTDWRALWVRPRARLNTNVVPGIELRSSDRPANQVTILTELERRTDIKVRPSSLSLVPGKAVALFGSTAVQTYATCPPREQFCDEGLGVLPDPLTTPCTPNPLVAISAWGRGDQ